MKSAKQQTSESTAMLSRILTALSTLQFGGSLRMFQQSRTVENSSLAGNRKTYHQDCVGQFDPILSTAEDNRIADCRCSDSSAIARLAVPTAWHTESFTKPSLASPSTL